MRPYWRHIVLLASFLLQSCLTRQDLDQQELNFKTVLSADDPLVQASVLVIGTGRGGRISFCNGVLLDSGLVLTAAHCIVKEFRYFTFLPRSWHTVKAFTHVKMQAQAARAVRAHEGFRYDLNIGLVEHDIALIDPGPIAASKKLHGIKAAEAKFNVKTANTLKWIGDDDEAFFRTDVRNNVELTGYKVERDRITDGVLLIRDVASIVGRVPKNKSWLVTTNPGTSIHQGVSGSGMFIKSGNEYRVLGVTSHFFPGINLVSTTNVVEHAEWLEKMAAEFKKAK